QWMAIIYWYCFYFTKCNQYRCYDRAKEMGILFGFCATYADRRIYFQLLSFRIPLEYIITRFTNYSVIL
ncbi:hypothetical protein ABTE36_20960, partial [Acinetobacter baumannii]